MLSRAKSLPLYAALAVALVAGAVAFAAETGMIVTERSPQGSPSELRRATNDKITVRGSVKRLYPGRMKLMRVRVRSPYSQPVDLRSVRTTVGDASPACPRSNIRVKRFAGRQPIEPHRHAFVRVEVRMRKAAPDACQNARFPLEFRAELRGQGQAP